jgi:N-methylhydantoinase B
MAYVADLAWRALAPWVPERLTAGHFLSACAETIAGTNPSTGAPFILYEPNCGGWGAGYGQDGESALTDVGDGETYMIPVEVIEQRYGVFVECFSLNCTDAGAGHWRGGSGIVREYRILSDDATLTASFGRHEYTPWGVGGGLPGSCNEVLVIPADGSPPVRAGTFSRHALRHGDRVRLVTGSGGGWGDPRDRDKELVARDLANGYITPESAAGVYGADGHAGNSKRASAESGRQAGHQTTEGRA